MTRTTKWTPGPRPTEIRTAVPYYVAMRDFRARLIEATLAVHDGNRTHAARALGIRRTYLQRLIHDLGLRAPRPAP